MAEAFNAWELLKSLSGGAPQNMSMPEPQMMTPRRPTASDPAIVPRPQKQMPVQQQQSAVAPPMVQMAMQSEPMPTGNDPLSKSYKNYAENQMMQQNEINNLKSALANYAQSERGIDFTPLAALSDTWFGGNLSAAAKQTAPESREQKIKNIADMQKAIAAAQGEIPKQELDELKARLQQQGYDKSRQTDLEVARINAEARKSGIKQEVLLQREAARLDKETQSLEKRIGDITPGIVTKLSNLENLIPGGIDGDESSDVPGVGPAMFAVPDFMLGQDASDIQQNARGLAADLIKLQSGTAASDKEVDRKMKELGMSSSSKSSTFRSGVKRLKKQLEVELRNKEAGFRPEAKEIYKSRGGITHESVQAIGGSKKTGLSEEKQKRLNELKQKLGK